MNFENIKVSIITPTYNCEKYIDETLDSILNQTHHNIEVIIVDDCSKDSTVLQIKRRTDDRIKLFENRENKGAAFCRNLAIASATGDYIAFLDGDDIWRQDKLEKQLEYMVSNNIEFCYTKYNVLDNKSGRLVSAICGPKIVSYKDFLKYDYIGCLTVMYKKSLCPSLSIPESLKKRNDYALWLVLSKYSACYFFDENLSIYRKRSGTISSGSKFSLIKHHVILFQTVLGLSKFKANLYSIRNGFYYLFVKPRFIKKIKKGVDDK